MSPKLRVQLRYPGATIETCGPDVLQLVIPKKYGNVQELAKVQVFGDPSIEKRKLWEQAAAALSLSEVQHACRAADLELHRLHRELFDAYTAKGIREAHIAALLSLKRLSDLKQLVLFMAELQEVRDKLHRLGLKS